MAQWLQLFLPVLIVLFLLVIGIPAARMTVGWLMGPADQLLR